MHWACVFLSPAPCLASVCIGAHQETGQATFIFWAMWPRRRGTRSRVVANIPNLCPSALPIRKHWGILAGLFINLFRYLFNFTHTSSYFFSCSTQLNPDYFYATTKYASILLSFMRVALLITKQAYICRLAACHSHNLWLSGQYLKGRRSGMFFKWNLEKLPEFHSTVSLVPERRRRMNIIIQIDHLKNHKMKHSCTTYSTFLVSLFYFLFYFIQPWEVQRASKCHDLTREPVWPRG